jgi:hypothetical protein
MGRRARVNAKKRNKRIVSISIVVAIIAVVLVLYLVVQAVSNVPGNQYSTYIGQPVSSAVLQDLTGVSNTTLEAVGAPTTVTPPASISGTPLTLNGKPEVLYVGGEYCPFCAVERWSLIIALSHFGNFSGLEYMQSSSTDTNANTPTFTFANATFTSKYIAFVPIEEWNRATSTLSTLDSTQSSLYSQYGTCSTTGDSGIPFVDIGNQYVVNCGAQFNAGLGGTVDIAGENWTQVASQLNDSSAPIAQLMDGAANTLITAICKIDGSQPASLCSQQFAEVTLSYATASSPSSGQQLVTLAPQVREESRWTG